MSDTQAALKAAREVQADTITPDLYRQAQEWWFKARKEYKFKNFSLASDYAAKAKKLAEQSEYEALRTGANRASIAPPEPEVETNAPEPYDYPTPVGTPFDGSQQNNAEPEAPSTPTPPETK